ncbi:MAG: UDP-N-acetylglucosamine--N-acetylmuramyl-(pentapeptide) pyrophosphoryl-undecaprenol N-acetylglucosamine transferase [Bacilli bacterium]|nr:UDP-N-acetylglucosamine--N-acetylmuramyl-(pentapeptide) pyrophosphoryl-undecaprenol N-acetylglucosamine transferase [Bacilli bacterium]
MKYQNYIFACGGTLGHIMPAISMAKEIKKKKPLSKIIFIMTIKEKKYQVINDCKEIDEKMYFDISGFDRKNPFNNISNFFKILNVLIKLKSILPTKSIVIGMGGYISYIVIHSAFKKKIPSIIHEQNVVIGLANKMSLKKVKKVLSAFPLDDEKSITIGNPRMMEADTYLNNKKQNNHLVITSGSLGSKKINDLAVQFLTSEEKENYYTTLVTGKKYYEDVIKRVGTNKTPYFEIIPFKNNMLELFSDANLVISRAGATTIFEIIGLMIPSILIPSPNVTNNHQYYNALFLQKQNACTLLEEDDLTVDILEKNIKKTINNQVISDNLKKIKKSYENINIVEVLENLA